MQIGMMYVCPKGHGGVGEETVQRNHVSEEGRKKGLLRRNSANTEPLFISFFFIFH